MVIARWHILCLLVMVGRSSYLPEIDSIEIFL
jgi:hypothetical protein